MSTVRENEAEGFERPTACAADYFFPLPKSSLQEKLGAVRFERQQQIKIKIKEPPRL